MSLLPEIFFNRRQRIETIVLCAVFLSLLIVRILPRREHYILENTVDLEQYRVEIGRITAPSPSFDYTQQPFNPNFISDYRAYVLNMPSEALDRLNQFRKNGNWVNSPEQFQEVTQISDQLLKKIQPLFEFPQWINYSAKSNLALSTNKIDLNRATIDQLVKVYGIGAYRANQIINYRDGTLGGFADLIELHGINGLTQEVIDGIGEQFEILNPRKINKIKAHSAAIEQWVTIPFIDYELAHNIVEQRSLHGGILNEDILSKTTNLPIDKLGIILLYLDFSDQ